MTTHHPLVTDLAREIPLGAAALHDLEQHSPTANVWEPLTHGTPQPWTEL
jgi:hypothetical protein